MAFFLSRLIVRASGRATHGRLLPSNILTRAMCDAPISQPAIDLAAERRRRKSELRLEPPTGIVVSRTAFDMAEERRRLKREHRLEPPFGALRNRDAYARRQRHSDKSNLPEPITVLKGDRLSLHNRIQSRCRAGLLDEAIQGVRHAMFSKIRPTVFTCNSLLGHLQRAGRHGDVISNFKFIIQSGVIPNIVTYNILLATHCENLDMDAAFDVFKTLSTSDVVKPSHVTYNHLMTAQFKLKNYDGVMELFREMLEKCYGADPPTYAATIEGLVNGGSMDHATELYQEMKKRGSIFSEPVFCNLIKGYFTAGRVSDAMEVFEFVTEKVERTVLSYNAVLYGMCTTGRVGEAEGFLAEMESVGPNADSYAILMKGLIGQNKFDEAVRVSEAYRSSGKDLGENGAVVYDLILDGFFKAGRVLECEEIVVEMVEKGCGPSEVSFDLLIDGFLKEGRVEEFLRSFRRVLEGGFKPGLGVYNKLFGCLCDVGKLDEVRGLLEGMVDGGIVPDVGIYDVLMGRFGKEGREDEVKRVFENVVEKGIASEELVARIGGQTEESKLQTKGALNGMEEEIERKDLGVRGEERETEVAAAATM